MNVHRFALAPNAPFTAVCGECLSVYPIEISANGDRAVLMRVGEQRCESRPERALRTGSLGEATITKGQPQ